MSEKPEANSHAIAWIMALVVAPVVYLLSAGPMNYLNLKYHLELEDKPAVLAFYVPWNWLYMETPLEKPLKIYGDWWWELAQTP